MDNNNQNTAVDNLKSTREIIRARRTELGISRKQLAKMIGKNLRTVIRYENGETAIPLSVLVDICKALDIDIMFLRGRE